MDDQNLSISQLCLEREKTSLSKFAFLTSNTRGRDFPYSPSSIRTEFQRDRDRIIHSKSFRRLAHKTQVFLFPVDEHFRTRLTHTLEVTQIARIICRAMRLNEDLAEAASLGHDLGHTPFGHAGERTMQECFSSDFTHYKQSLRVVEKLEHNGEGLNLTWEVRDAIVNHTPPGVASTLEGVVVKFADKIAYINHDIDDAQRAGILKLEDIPKDILEVLGYTHSKRINTMVESLISASYDKPEICFTKEVGEATDKLHKFLFDNVYLNPIAKAEEHKAMDLVASLYDYYLKNSNKLPDIYKQIAREESVERAVCDYISGMTDRYAIDKYKELFIPLEWNVSID